MTLFLPATVEDPYPALARLRETDPVHRVPGTDFFLVSTWDLVQEANARTADFSSHLRSIMCAEPGSLVPHPLAMDGAGTVEQVLATADDPDHKLHRGLVTQTLTKRIRALREACDEAADRFWDDHAADGRIDWVEGMAERLPLAMLSTLIGLREADLPYLLARAYDATEMLSGIVDPARVEALTTATIELATYLGEQFALAQADPQDDLMGVFADAVARGDLEHSTVVLLLIQLVAAGAESTAALIETAARLLAEDPALQERLRSDPALIDPFLDEALRLESPFRGHYRSVPADTALGGVAIPAGSTVLLLWGGANRDPARFPDPDTLDLERPLIRQHVAFGKGIHFCVGSHLARMEAIAAVRVLLERTTSFALDPDLPPSWIPSIVVRRHRTLGLTFT
ncbi:cytochrome P450 [Nocardioides stalactiti]|uniref:cytochrome P450 n=1 Tax=Nocardioides stalactiti TaxID=2755356 RepID=UPI001C80EE2F|nr:cytochrome P450 [Nocardioides stalactiti]